MLAKCTEYSELIDTYSRVGLCYEGIFFSKCSQEKEQVKTALLQVSKEIFYLLKDSLYYNIDFDNLSKKFVHFIQLLNSYLNSIKISDKMFCLYNKLLGTNLKKLYC